MSPSQIDLCMGTASLLPLLTDIMCTPRGIYSLLVLHLEARTTTSMMRTPWKLNAFWVNFFPSRDHINRSIVEFIVAHGNYPDVMQSWVAFKAFLWGIFIALINRIKCSVLRVELEHQVRQLEQTYVDNPMDSAKGSWLSGCIRPFGIVLGR